MQLSVITDEISQDFEYALDVLVEYGVPGAELRGLWETNIAELSDEQVERALAALRARNLRVSCLSTPFYKCDLFDGASGGVEKRMHLANERGREQQMDILRRCIQLAHQFDTNLIRVFTFWRKDTLTPDIEDRIVEAFDAPLELAAREGITLVLENEHACFIGTGAEAARIAQKIDSPQLKICWDPGNAFFAGEIPYPDGYEAIKPWLGHVHIKDARIAPTPKGEQPVWSVVGEGEIDYIGQFAALKRDGYTGYVSLETHYVPSSGSGPNGEGTREDGSRLCLVGLKKLLKE